MKKILVIKKLPVATPMKKMNGKPGKTQKMVKAPAATKMTPRTTAKKMPQRKPNSKLSGRELLDKALKGF